MNNEFTLLLRRTSAAVLAFCAAAPGVSAQTPAQALQQLHVSISPQLQQNAYGRPLVIESSEGNNRVSGHAYAVMAVPFTTLSAQLKKPAQWCEVMILHLNTKYCRAEGSASAEKLKVSIGKKTPQTLADAPTLSFAFKLTEASDQYFAAQLGAREGPLGTSDYAMELQAIPLADGKTFLHLQYAYGYGMAGKIAMQAYLATSGRSKVGFTKVSSGQASGYVGGMRGAVERNTMRYYLAIEAYMDSLQSPVNEQVNKRFNDWFTATEKYPRQLEEVDRESYLAMKKSEYARQQAPM